MRVWLTSLGMWLLMILWVVAIRWTPVHADDVPACKPGCPSAKTIAEQVVENIDAKPRPTIVKCGKGHGSRAGSGFTARCLVLFPAAGTPPLVVEE